MEYPLTEAALIKLGQAWKATIRRNIKKKQFPYGHPNQKGTGNKIASGGLYESVDFSVVETNGAPRLVLEIANYAFYVDKGRAPRVRRVPLDVLMSWISIKGLQGRDKKGRFMSRTNLAWAIQTNIFKYGIRPAEIFGKAKTGMADWLDPNKPKANLPPELKEEFDDFYEAIGDDLQNYLQEQIDTIIYN
jgi:hypothetical protein